MNIAFVFVFVVWIGSELVLSWRMRAGKGESGHRDSRTLAVIYAATVSATTIATAVALFSEFPIWRMPETRYFGMLIIISGMALRIWSMIMLGRFFTYNVALRDGHELIRSGPYRVLRHPSYTGLLFSFFGYGVALNNWISLVAVFIPVFLAFSRRIAVEETVLSEHFGDLYTEYKRRTWRLIPLVY
ncbi:methyltransferase family protein [Paraburkholderia dinghuensis]|uniref:Isoprenylcysteine carboxylmethyltransferase family protein n=1 Tax=Paraburkholderia dinghuensis TaxID=2305225 RepID=A0A3N6Q1L9_9BURK|nr:isoprenylcysteine carboxylmethyltransferase family protein [Paraburkholderia dinghuensis]RQH08900.1 isoprenylcysteine carboxylmethyltransferase family protein [Paraburkholderia dinghuensis]